MLDASGSTDPGGDALSFAWDLDDDGSYDDAVGATPTVPWATLLGLGLASDGSPMNVGMQVDDGQGGIDTAATTVVISNLDPTAAVAAPAPINEGESLLLDATASTDPGK